MFTLAACGVISINPVHLGRWTTVLIVGIAAACFAWAFLLAGLDATEKKRMAVIAVLFAASALFWSGFEQVGSSLNLFGKEHTERLIAMFNWEFPAGWLQSVNALFVITLAPVIAALWLRLARRDISPSLPVKVA